jgi:hypothetical protein
MNQRGNNPVTAQPLLWRRFSLLNAQRAKPGAIDLAATEAMQGDY